MNATRARRLWLLFAVAVALLSSAPAARAQSLYWIDTSFGAPTLNRADANGNPLSGVVQPVGSLPEGLGIDAAGNVYWGEAAWTNAKINRAAANLSGIAPIVSGGSSFRGVAVDPVTNLVYWTTSNLVTGATIRRASTTGTGVTTLISLPLGSNPRGIAVDHSAGKLYWVDFDQSSIYRCNLDGSAAVVWLARPAGSGLYGIVVDAVGQFVYWTEYNTGVVMRATTAAASVTTLVAGLANPTYIALDPVLGRIYWSAGGAGAQRIQRATTGGASLTTFTLPLTTYGGLVYSTYGLVAAPVVDVPTEFAIERVWPSPGRGAVQVAFALPRESRVRIGVFDLQGREVQVLTDGVLPAGHHQTTWGQRTSQAGVYFVRLAVDGRTWSRRVVRMP